MSGVHRRGPVGLGYMPKGGAKAAQASNDVWGQRERARVEVASVAPVESATAGGVLDARQRGRVVVPAAVSSDRRRVVVVASAGVASAAAVVSGLAVMVLR